MLNRPEVSASSNGRRTKLGGKHTLGGEISMGENGMNSKPATNDHPLGPEKAVFSGRWSLVRSLPRTTVYKCENARAWQSGL